MSLIVVMFELQESPLLSPVAVDHDDDDDISDRCNQGITCCLSMVCRCLGLFWNLVDEDVRIWTDLFGRCFLTL